MNNLTRRLEFSSLWRRIKASLGALMFGVSLTVLPAAADIALEPGDNIRATITGLDNIVIEASVDISGAVDLGVLGVHNANKVSVSDLEASVRTETTGLIIKQYDREGELYIIQLGGDEVEIMRNGYRPVIISGDVAAPGELVFRPGITVREMVALAGGARSQLITDETTVDPIQLIRWQGEFGAAALKHADAVVTIWRMERELSGEDMTDAPGSDDVSVANNVLEELIAEQVAIADLNRETYVNQIAYFDTALEQAAARSEILSRQQAQLRQALEDEEAELTRLAELVERGLAPEGRLSDGRRDTVQTATRLLDVEEDLAASVLANTGLERDRAAYIEEFELLLLQGIEENRTDQRDAGIQMGILSQYLVTGTDENISEGLIAGFDYDALIFRRVDTDVERIVADRSTAVNPGDIIEITIRTVDTEALTD